MTTRQPLRLVSGVVIVCALLSGCGPDDRPGPTAKPVDTSPRPVSQADPSQPVSSGNTPTAADIAAIAALNVQFDPGRNPMSDLQTAEIEAQRGGRRIILDVGGRWCDLCRQLDDVINSDSALRSFRDTHYVWVKINYSDENPNHSFLAHWPILRGFPHIFILDGKGSLLFSQPITALMTGQKIDRTAFYQFLQHWALNPAQQSVDSSPAH